MRLRKTKHVYRPFGKYVFFRTVMPGRTSASGFKINLFTHSESTRAGEKFSPSALNIITET